MGCKIDYYDPSYRYADWTQNSQILRVFRRLVDECARDRGKSEAFNKITFDSDGVAGWGQDEVIHGFVERGWSLIAAQKIPPEELARLRYKEVAIPMRLFHNPDTGRVIEENPVLMHPRVGDFILARLAREISQQERVPTVTFEDGNFCNQNYAPSQRGGSDRDILMSAIVSLSIPHDIVKLRTGEYAEVREAYGPARMRIASMIRELSENYRLEDIRDFEQLKSAVADAATDIERQVQAALNERRSIRNRAHQMLNQNIIWGIGSALAGYAIEGPLGAAAGGILSPLAADLANRLSPPKAGYEMVETLASIRGSIKRGVSRSKISIPSYMI